MVEIATKLEINKELLSHIQSMQVLDINRKPLTYAALNTMELNQNVIIVLICVENIKFKLKNIHFANVTVKEARIYVELGVPEYVENEEED